LFGREMDVVMIEMIDVAGMEAPALIFYFALS